jgi:hypothetical protein
MAVDDGYPLRDALAIANISALLDLRMPVIVGALRVQASERDQRQRLR